MKSDFKILLGIIGIDLVLTGAIFLSIMPQHALLPIAIFVAGIVMLGVWVFYTLYRTKIFDTGRKVFLSADIVIGSGLFIFALVFINLLGTMFSKKIDMTGDRLFSLSTQTLQILDKLDKNVELIYFDNIAEPKNPEYRDLAKLYTSTGKITFKALDPDVEPAIAKKFGVSDYGQAVLVADDEHHTLITTFDEQNISNAIKKQISPITSKVYFMVGHGELSPFDSGDEGLSALATSLGREGYAFDTLNLQISPQIPVDCALLTIASPKTELFDGEIVRVDSFLTANGSVMFLFEPQRRTKLTAMLEKYDVIVDDDIVLDDSPTGKMIGASDEMPLITFFEKKHPVTADFENAIMFVTARSIRPIEPKKTSYWVVELIKTSDQAWAENDIVSATHKFDPTKHKRAQMTLGCAVSHFKTKTKAVVLGDADFVSNRYAQVPGNITLALKSVGWLTHSDDIVTIGPKDAKDRKLLLTGSLQQRFFYMSVIMLPFLAILLAQIVWWKKSGKSKEKAF
jgi:ABC-type uncharacterized transport system involved in gliding motility auxiliary subunit